MVLQSRPLPPRWPLALLFFALGCDGCDETALTDGGLVDGAVTDGSVPIPSCPPMFALPTLSECDGTDLLAEENSAMRTDGIMAVEGPDGAAAVQLGDDQSIELRNDPCLQLGRDGADFSVSLWFRIPEGGEPSATIFGNGSSAGSTDGFAVTVRNRDGEPRLSVVSGGGDGRARITTSDIPVEASRWNHLVLIFRDQANFQIMINGVPTSLENPFRSAYGDLYRESGLRLGDPGFGTSTPIEVSDTRSYARTVSTAEVRALYFEHAAAGGLSGDTLDAALAALSGHFGSSPLSDEDFDAAVRDLVDHATALPQSEERMRNALDLIDGYETSVGPLFLNGETGAEITQAPEAGESATVREARAMVVVHQAIFDHGFTDEAIGGCGDLFEGRAWQTAAHFPGSVQPGAEVMDHSVQVDASKPAFVGRPVAFATQPARRPTGLYLPPGAIGEVRVPAALIGRGFTVLVGAHTHIQDVDPESNRAHRRLPHVAQRFELVRDVTTIANPLGGGIYIEVPYLADAGVVDITISGVVEAPFFSMRSFDRMNAEDWRARRTSPAPWADFVTDTYMVQVPRHWVYALEDPIPGMTRYDDAMDGFSELFGWEPEERNDVVLYMQPDVWIRHGQGGIGYPQINFSFDPADIRDGNREIYLLNDPVNQLELHELGHAQLVTKFRGETEALVNFPMAYVLNEKFGMDLDEAFGISGSGARVGAGAYTPDQAAVHWMITENFRDGLEMDRTNSTLNQMRYQHRGYAKYADVARLFGWEALRSFYRAEHAAYLHHQNTPRTLGSADDDRILRMSIAAGADLTPLMHFWGNHPEDAEALAAAITEASVPSSPEIETLLRRYRELIPADNDAFDVFFETIYVDRPTDGNPDFGHGWYNVWLPLYDTTHAERSRVSLDAILALYFS